MPFLPLLLSLACVGGPDPSGAGTGVEGAATCPPLATADVWVDARAEADGDGTAAHPFVSVQVGADSAAKRGGGTVAIAAGRYRETLSLTDDHDGVNLAGACRAEVILDGEGSAPDQPLVRIDAPRTQLMMRGLTLTGGGAGGVALFSGALEIDDVDLVANHQYAIAAWTAKASLHLSDTVVRASLPALPGAESAPQGDGVIVYDGAVAMLSAVDMAANAGRGLVVGGTHTAADVVGSRIRDHLGSGAYAYGALIAAGGTARFTDVDVAGNHLVGVAVRDGTTHLTMEGGSITDTSSEEGFFGAGLYARAGGTASLTDMRIAGNRDAGVQLDTASVVELDGAILEQNGNVALMAVGEGCHATLRGCRIGHSLPVQKDVAHGVVAKDGATIDVSASVMEDMDGTGIAALSGAVVSIEGSVIRDIRDPTGDGWGVCALAVTGGQLRLYRSRLERCRGSGLATTDAGSHALVVDSSIDLPTLDANSGGYRPVQVVAGASADLLRTRITGGSMSGIFLENVGSSVSATDVEISGVRRATDISIAAGLIVQHGAAFFGSGLRIDAIEGPGMVAVDATLACDGCVVRGVSFAGAISVDDAELSLTRFAAEGIIPDASLGGGVDLYAGFGGAVTLLGSNLGVAPLAAVWLDDCGPTFVEGSALASGSGVALRPDLILNGNAVVAVAGSIPTLTGNRFGSGVGPTVLIDNASAILSENDFTDGGSLAQQNCSAESISPVGIGGLHTATLCPRDALLLAPMVYDVSMSVPEVTFE